MLTQYNLEQRAKRLETRIEIALRDCLWDEADNLNDELFFVQQTLAAMSYIAMAR